jgi:MraZ protein
VALFLSTYVNKVDRKGRVSVPATFRAILAEQRSPTVVVFRAFRVPALEAGGEQRMQEIDARLQGLDEYSDDFLSLRSLFADAHQLTLDPEGRILLPQQLLDHANITDAATFAGLGRSFQIWEPGAFEERQAAMRERARQQIRLPPHRPE